jgi:DNA polymerase-3 subunit gamma/tau
MVKTIRRVGSSFTPSIKDALAGKVVEKSIIDEIAETTYNEYESYTEAFTSEQLTVKWNEFLGLISDRPNLISTLSNVPELTDGNKLLLKIGNSVQEEDVRQIKPELINFLRKELRNSGIEMTTSIEKIESERTHFNDSEKMQLLMQKNPELFELKQKFNLDFNA